MSTSKKGNGPAFAKRAKIDKAQRNMLMFVCIASVVLGVTLVMVAHFARLISFNYKIMDAQNEAIKVYSSAQSSLSQVQTGIENLITNENFESVARKRGTECETFDIYLKDESKESLIEQSPKGIGQARKCTALRVITDALPSTKNIETAMTSFRYLLKGRDGESSGYAEVGDLSYVDGTKQIKVGGKTVNAFTLTAGFSTPSQNSIGASLESVDTSIRAFDASKATITIDNESKSIMVSSQFNAYFSSEAGLTGITKIVCANAKNEACTKAGGDGSVKQKNANDTGAKK